jgi:hypothetical protein
MVEASQIREHMEVVTADNEHLGRVDHVMGTEIELAKMDLQAMGQHHKIPLSWVDYIDDKVHLNLSRDDAKDRWLKAN